jgi:hypothetical protein
MIHALRANSASFGRRTFPSRFASLAGQRSGTLGVSRSVCGTQTCPNEEVRQPPRLGSLGERQTNERPIARGANPAFACARASLASCTCASAGRGKRLDRVSGRQLPLTKRGLDETLAAQRDHAQGVGAGHPGIGSGRLNVALPRSWRSGCLSDPAPLAAAGPSAQRQGWPRTPRSSPCRPGCCPSPRA